MNWDLKIREIMQERGLKQKDLAEMLGVSRASISSILQKDARISSLERIAFVLKVPIATFFEEEEQKPVYDEKYRETHVHGYIRIGKKIVEINSMRELKDAVTACEVNYLK